MEGRKEWREGWVNSMTLQIKNFHFHPFQLEIQASVERGFIKMPPLTQPLPGKYTRIPGQPETP